MFLLAGCATPEPPSGNPASYSSLMRVAASTVRAGDPGAAVALYRHAHQLKPNQPEPLVAIGQILDRARAFTGAENAFDAALKLSPRNADALRGLGNTLIFLDQPQAAISKFKAALALQPKATDIFNDYGVALDMLGRHKAAQAKYRQGLAIAPSDLGLTTNLGLSLALSGDYQQALHYLRPLAGNSESTPRMRDDLALVYGLTGDDNAAAKVAGIDLDPESVHDNLAYYKALRRWVDQFRDYHPSPSLPVLGNARPAAVSEAPLKAKAGAASAASSSPMMAGPVTDLHTAPTKPSLANLAPSLAQKANTATTKPAPPPERSAMSQSKAEKPATAPAKLALVKAKHVAASQPPKPLVKALLKATAKKATAGAEPAPGATAQGVDHDERSPATARVQLGNYSTIPVAAARWHALLGHYPVLRRLHPVIVQVDLGPRGIFERLQTGPFPTHAAAAAFCAKLKANHQTCLVLPANDAAESDTSQAGNTRTGSASLVTTDP